MIVDIVGEKLFDTEIEGEMLVGVDIVGESDDSILPFRIRFFVLVLTDDLSLICDWTPSESPSLSLSRSKSGFFRLRGLEDFEEFLVPTVILLLVPLLLLVLLLMLLMLLLLFFLIFRRILLYLTTCPIALIHLLLMREHSSSSSSSSLSLSSSSSSSSSTLVVSSSLQLSS